jgi:hypothetical protein
VTKRPAFDCVDALEHRHQLEPQQRGQCCVRPSVRLGRRPPQDRAHMLRAVKALRQRTIGAEIISRDHLPSGEFQAKIGEMVVGLRGPRYPRGNQANTPMPRRRKRPKVACRTGGFHARSARWAAVADDQPVENFYRVSVFHDARLLRLFPNQLCPRFLRQRFIDMSIYWGCCASGSNIRRSSARCATGRTSTVSPRC